MYLKELFLNNYKNFEELELQFSPKLNCFIGNNGVGKTNLLDAVYYLSFSKSFMNQQDQLNIRHGAGFFSLKGIYDRLNEQEEIFCGYRSGEKKKMRRNKKEYERLSDHIGLLPLVMISPSDSILIQGGSEERRRFIDGVISQFDHTYLDRLLKYNRALVQRNSLLKSQSPSSAIDPLQLEIWNDQLILHGEKIFEARTNFVKELIPVFQEYYNKITGGAEAIALLYKSQLQNTSFEELLNQSLKKDLIMQYTTSGVHRDDLELMLGDYPMRKIGSQGQNKTYLVALKFAQFDFIGKRLNMNPLLLLDDLFDKLDSRRVEQIVSIVSDPHFGQIFITDTNREHLDSIIRESGSADARIFIVSDGTVKPYIPVSHD